MNAARREHGRALAIVGAFAVCFAAVYIALDFNALYALRANQNTGLYLQSIVNFVHTGSTFDQPDGTQHLLVHDQWLVYALFALPVLLWPRPETLIVGQQLALALAAFPLFFFSRACGAPPYAAAFLAVAFLLSPSMQGFAYDGFVPEDLIPLFAFALALVARSKSLPWTAVVAIGLLGIKEDEALFLAWFGALGAIWFDRRLGLTVLGLAVAAGFAYYGVALHFGGRPQSPSYGLSDAQWPQQLAFLVEMLVPFGFAPLGLGWPLLAALPFLFELFFTQNRTYPLYHVGAYYTVPLVSLAALAAAYVVAQRPSLARYALAGSALMALLFNNASVLHLGRRPFALDPQYAAARSWATTATPVNIPCEDVGAWTVASPNPNAKLTGCGQPVHHRTRPAWRDEPLRAIAPWTHGAARAEVRERGADSSMLLRNLRRGR